jgi:hypothetical protein
MAAVHVTPEEAARRSDRNFAPTTDIRPNRGGQTPIEDKCCRGGMFRFVQGEEQRTLTIFSARYRTMPPRD